MASSTVIMVGTRKGLWIGRSDDRLEWTFTGPHFDMTEVFSCLIDTRGDSVRLLAGAASSWFGTSVSYSDDLGASWHSRPEGALRFPKSTGTSLERVWQLVAGVDDGVVYAGTEPGAVFRSGDRGETFTLEQALWDHPHRTEWGQGFGGQAFHTVLPHPTDPKSLTCAISTGGVYQTRDGGQSWEATNTGIRTEFMPDDVQYPEFGQCVHKIARHPAQPERMFLQNHGGVYRSDDEGHTWTSIEEGLPASFGFPVAVHPSRPDTLYVFPLNGADRRYPPQARAALWRSDDAGSSWQPLSEGLPDDFYVAVMRDALCTDLADPAGLYLGARDGTVWASADEGESWQQIAANLPDVMAVRATTLAA